MGKSQLTVEETRQMLLSVARGLQSSKEMLTHADQAIGDGDHGIGMARGFEAVEQKLTAQSFGALDELYKTTGTALLTSIGGAAGAVFGTLFRGGAKNLAGRTEFDSSALASWLNDGLQAVQERGKAKPGDKTMIDALQPAGQAAAQMAGQPLDAVAVAAAEAARQGMEKTKQMVATTGKAKTLGERSLGSADPGSISMYLILKYMADWLAA